jgi:hypothetical protein
VGEEMTDIIVTPAQVEQKMIQLSKEIDIAQVQLESAETNYNDVKAKYELGLAKARIRMASEKNANGKPMTATEKDDFALVENEDLHLLLASAEAVVRASRANASRLKTQVDLARSIGSSVRASLDLQ